jgi:hypothetical protein
LVSEAPNADRSKGIQKVVVSCLDFLPSIIILIFHNAISGITFRDGNRRRRPVPVGGLSRAARFM